MSKLLLFDKQAKEKLLTGIKILESAVSSTLGPLGSNVSIDKKWGIPNVIHDGVSVAKEIDLDDPFENMGAQLVKEAASKTNDVAGDGTTTSTILARSLVENGFKKIDEGVNPMKLRREILEASKKVVESIRSEAKTITSKEEIQQIATVSSQDIEIGEKVAEAINKTGKDGVITVEEGSGRDINIKYTEGMEFDRGYASPYFITNPEKMESEIKNPHIFITDKKITSQQDFVSILTPISKTTKDIVIIADEIEGEALANLILNKMRGAINVLAIKAPGFGDRRKEMLEDIAVLVGARVISGDLGESFENIKIEDLGQARTVWSDKDNTRIIGGSGDKLKIDERIKSIKKQMSSTGSEFDKEKLQERLSKLTNGVAVIEVGANTEVELIEKKERIKDAVAATKAAVEEGIVPGGAITLIHAANKLGSGDGEEVLSTALKSPPRTLFKNAGISFSEAYKQISSGNLGIDVMDGKLKDMVEAGIIEPTKVVVSAIENAVSVATTILTTKVLIADKKEEKDEH